jgi:type II secretory pathway component PulK
VIIALTALILSISVQVRSAAMAQANRTAYMQAAAAERGAEQLLLAMVDQKMYNRMEQQTDLTDNISLQALRLGNCYIWVIKPTYDDGQTANPEETYSYGLTDEMAKLDINTAPYSMLEWLPGLTNAMAASIVTWRGAADPTGMGATDTYYESLPDPYEEKQGPFESVQELLLVQGFTPQVLWGFDTNHNGVLSQAEISAAQAAGGSLDSDSGTDRGIFPFVSALPAGAGQIGVSGNNPATEIANVNNLTQLRTVLTNVLGGGQANEILGHIVTGGPGARFDNVFSFYFESGMTPQQFTQVYPRLTANSQGPLVNIMTAPPQVLDCLPGLQNNTSLVQSIISQRQAQLQSTTDPTNLAWLVTLPQLRTALTNTLGDFITGASTVYGGDIVAVTANGRAFCRCRIIIQAGNGTSTDSKIIYRENVTGDGWPLDTAIRKALREGRPPPIAPSTDMNTMGEGTL